MIFNGKFSYRLRRITPRVLNIFYRLTRLYLIWKVLTVICLSVNLAILVDISSRFLGGEPGTLGVLAVITQGIITLISSGSLSSPGRKIIRKTFIALNLKRKLWRLTEFGLSALALLSLVSFRLFLGVVAIIYNNYGLKQYADRQVNSAKSSFEMAIRIDPDLAHAHGNLGRIYDDYQDHESAKHQYILATRGGSLVSYSKLARIYIIEGGEDNYAQAVFLSVKALSLAQYQNIQNKSIEYDLLTTFGWARLHQNRLDSALEIFNKAISLKSKKASAYCLNAQVLEKLGYKDQALDNWRSCLEYASACRRDEDKWIGLASERLNVKEPQFSTPCPKPEASFF